MAMSSSAKQAPPETENAGCIVELYSWPFCLSDAGATILILILVTVTCLPADTALNGLGINRGNPLL